MARQTYDLGEQCSELDMLRAYGDLAGLWLVRAEQSPPASFGAGAQVGVVMSTAEPRRSGS